MPGKDNKKPEVAKRSYKRKPKHDPLPPSLLAKAAEAAAKRLAARPVVGKRTSAYEYSTSTVDVVDNRERKVPVPKNAMNHENGISAGQPKKFKVLDFVPSRNGSTSIAKSTPPVLVEVLSFQRMEKISDIKDLLAETTEIIDSDEKVKEMAEFLADMKATFGLNDSTSDNFDDFDPQPVMTSSTPIKAPRESESETLASSGTRKEFYADEGKKSKRVKGEKVDWSKVPVNELSLYATESEESEDEADITEKANGPRKILNDPLRSSEHFDLLNHYECMVNVEDWTALQ